MITIDGTASSGKRTVAQKIANTLGIAYCDTGAMYRYVTYAIFQKHINIQKEDQLAEFLKNFTFEFKDDGPDRHYILDGEDVTKKIHMPDVTFFVTKVASTPAIREKLVDIQRALATAAGGKAVFTGRDMGTVVFPDAAVKIFLTGNPELRAKWRYRELKSAYPDDYAEMAYEDTFEEITDRDDADMSREISPLRIPKDAEFIDVTNLTVDEVVSKIIAYNNKL